DCLLMTSLNEGSPQIIKEAMVAGVPVVSSNVGDVKNLLRGVQNSYVINSFDANQFITPIKRIMALNYKHRVTNGKERIIELKIDQDSIVEKIYNVYKQTIADHEKEI
ncbi:MAG: glycosyltransferase, partial [Fulvivirga sp.]